MSRDGRVYVVIRRPPTALAHCLKILTPFANAVGWMHGVSKVKGVPNGFSVLGTRLTRSMVVSFNSGNFDFCSVKMYFNQLFQAPNKYHRLKAKSCLQAG